MQSLQYYLNPLTLQALRSKCMHSFFLPNSVIYCHIYFSHITWDQQWEPFTSKWSRIKCSYFKRNSSRFYGELSQSYFLSYRLFPVPNKIQSCFSETIGPNHKSCIWNMDRGENFDFQSYPEPKSYLPSPEPPKDRNMTKAWTLESFQVRNVHCPGGSYAADSCQNLK